MQMVPVPKAPPVKAAPDGAPAANANLVPVDLTNLPVKRPPPKLPAADDDGGLRRLEDRRVLFPSKAAGPPLNLPRLR